MLKVSHTANQNKRGDDRNSNEQEHRIGERSLASPDGVFNNGLSFQTFRPGVSTYLYLLRYFGNFRTYQYAHMHTILLVEDDQDLAATVTDHLVSERYTVEHAADGLIAEEMLTITSFDLLILDWSLPGKTGIEICREFRARGGRAPIIMLTGRRQIEEKEEGLDTGADDYLTKPFSLRELSARVRALLRRPEQVISSVLTVGDLTLDLIEHSLSKNGEHIHLQKQDFALLEFLMRHPNQVFTPEALINRVWSVESEATAESVRSAIKRLRQKLDNSKDENSLIENIPRVGYRLNNKPSGDQQT